MRAIRAIIYHKGFTEENAKAITKALSNFEENFEGSADDYTKALLKAIPVTKQFTVEEVYHQHLLNGPKIIPSLLKKGICLHTLYQVNPILAGHLFLREVAIRIDQAYLGNIKDCTPLYGPGEIFDKIHTFTNKPNAIFPWLFSNIGFFRNKNYAEIALKHWFIVESFMKRKESSKGNPICEMYGFKS